MLHPRHVFNDRQRLRFRVPARVAVVESVHIGQDKKHVSPDEVRRPRREAVVVTELDLAGRHRVVFVDDRERAQL